MPQEHTPRTSPMVAHPDDPELYRRLVQSVTDYAIYGLDRSGHVVSWNSGAERLKGYAADEIVGQHFSRFYTPEDAAAGKPERMLALAARDGRVEDEGWRVRRDGHRFWASVVISPLRDPDGEIVGFTKVTRDLTAHREAEETRVKLAAEAAAHAEAARRSEELDRLNHQLVDQAQELEAQAEELQSMAAHLEESNEELVVALERARAAQAAAEDAAAATEAAYQELDHFAYVASHDLKAPLRGIANLAEWIRDDLADALPPESREHMRLLQGRVQRMEALIDGILAYSRAARLRTEAETLDSGAVVAEAIDLLSPPPGARVTVQADMPTVLAERVPFQQVFMNLIGNALKFGHAFRTDLVVEVLWRDLGEEIEFLVRDNGPGIAAQFQERIWTIFQTLESRDRVEGTGIGLSVVRKIVETRGGRTWLDSAPGHGATFGFSWPRTPSRSPS